MRKTHTRVRALLIGLVVVVLLGGFGLTSLLNLNLSHWGPNSEATAFAHYPTAAELAEIVGNLPQQYSQLISVQTIGQTRNGKPLLGATIAAPGSVPPDERPALFIDAQQHARESIGSQVALYTIVDLLQRYDTDPVVQYLLRTRTIYYIPQMNPDGNDIFLADNANQRGNARPADLDGDGKLSEDGRDNAGLGTLERQLFHFSSDWIEQTHGAVFQAGWTNQNNAGEWINILGYGSDFVSASGRSIAQIDNDGDGKINEDELLGVDLNRNWDAAWDLGDGNASSLLYRGPSSFSEPETAAARNFVLQHPNIVSALDVHSGTEIILMPWSKSKTDIPPDLEMLDQLARKGSELTKAPHTIASQGLYVAYGTIKDWLYEQGILTLAPEIYRGSQFNKIVRLWPTNWYLTFGSVAEQFNPPPRDIALSGERWKGFLQYMLAALPDAYVANVSLEGNALSLSVGNSGLIESNLQVELWRGSQRLWTGQFSDLSMQAAQSTVADVTDGSYRMLVSSQPQIKIKTHQPFQQTISFVVKSGQLQGITGLVAPPDIGQPFGGLTAPVDPYETGDWHTR